MKASQFLISTLREDPQDAQVASHRWMMRAGLVRKLGAGLYSLMPMGLRVIKKIEAIVREEMNRSGAVEFELPVLVPAELWKQSGRWENMGREMFRLKDRHDNDNVLGPTHEETFTDLMKGVLRSYKDLPVNVYQIHTKFRDEIRPRFGVIRSREFRMKDAYSFHADEQSLDETYNEMRNTYRAIFARTGLKTIPVEADTGAMGGSGSEEFMVASEIGEETLLISEKEKYRGNQEKTPVIYKEELLKEISPPKGKKSEDLTEKISTPGIKTIEQLSNFLKVPETELLKTLLLRLDGKLSMIMIRGDRQLTEAKLKGQLSVIDIEPASPEDFKEIGSVEGCAGPLGLKKEIPVYYDKSAFTRSSWITGANEADTHLKNFIPSVKLADAIDVAMAEEGDPSPAGDGRLTEVKGIEVGHIFKLGKKYTEAFSVQVSGEDQKPVTPLMGCYGVGINRTMATVIEQSHDDKGIIWPVSVAPFEICLVTITKGSEEIAKAGAFYLSMLDQGFDVIWDDRPLRPGVRFNDAELIGYPVRLTLGKKYMENGEVEVQIRKTGETRVLSGSTEEILAALRQEIHSQYEELKKESV